MKWNYRIVMYADGSGFGLHEVYYDENNQPCLMSKEPVCFTGDSVSDVRFSVEQAFSAVVYMPTFEEPNEWRSQETEISPESPVDACAPSNTTLCEEVGSANSGKWSISTNEEYYAGVYDTEEEAILEGRASEFEQFWVAQCVDPIQPEALFSSWTVHRWIDSDVFGHEDYMGEWAEGHVNPTNDQAEELANEVRPLISAWLDRHKLRPTFWNVDPNTVRQINSETGKAVANENDNVEIPNDAKSPER